MDPNDMFADDDVSKAYSVDQMKEMWPQAKGELLGFARALARGDSVITAAQLRMAVQMADNYLKMLNTAPRC